MPAVHLALLYAASRLGLKDLVPAYLGTDLTDDDLLSGVSFASAGTGYDPLTSTLVVHNRINIASRHTSPDTETFDCRT
jgi:hypothetical protein